jgi:hypothetical protein
MTWPFRQKALQLSKRKFERGAAELLHPVKPTPGLTGTSMRSAWTDECVRPCAVMDGAEPRHHTRSSFTTHERDVLVGFCYCQ